jgi:hypothetical protein
MVICNVPDAKAMAAIALGAGSPGPIAPPPLARVGTAKGRARQSVTTMDAPTDLPDWPQIG